MNELFDSLPFKFFLKVGDGGDGHEREDKFLVIASHTLPQIDKAFKKAEFDYDLFLSKECDDYEVNKLSPKFVASYTEILNISDVGELFALSGGIDCDVYVRMYLSIAHLELTELKWHIVKDLPERNIGGYGLFYC
jgi:hypothetical protein